MTTIYEDLQLPDGTAPDSPVATLQLWGDTGPVAGYEQAGVFTVAGLASATGASWQIDDIPGNTAIDQPTGTVYRLTRTWPGLRDALVDYVTVPATGGPYAVGSILTDPPAAIAPSGLAAHAADSLLHGGGQLLAYADRATSFTTAATSATDVTSVTITFVVPDGPYVVESGAFALFEEARAGQIAVSSGSRTGGTSSLTTSTSHGLTQGRIAYVNLADTTYNGTWALASGSGTALTYAQTGVSNDASSGAGTIADVGAPPAGGTIQITLSDNTVIGQDGGRAQVDNDLSFLNRRVVVPNVHHAPTPGATITYKMRALSTHTTSDVSLIGAFFGFDDQPYLMAYTLGD